jgi:hypothetical protein
MPKRKKNLVLPGAERLTWKQICERYPDKHVTLVDIDWINRDSGTFRTAAVLVHTHTRKEMYALIKEAQERMGFIRQAALRYTGTPKPYPYWNEH